jgi:hypothetical protein
MNTIHRLCVVAVWGTAIVAIATGAETPVPKTVLGVKGPQFTLDGRPAFLLGISYYGGLAADAAALRTDLDQAQRHGFQWIRVWATWAAFGNDVSAVDGEGRPRPEHLDRLRRLVAECDARGMVVDVTLSRGNGVTGPPRLKSPIAHRCAVETIVRALQPHRNWYLDLSNERNIADQRHTSFAELKELRAAVRKLDPPRLVTASHAGDIGAEDLRAYLVEAGVDLLSPHRPRDAASPGETAAKTRDYLAQMKALGRVVPVHYQEPFRRGFNAKWEPAAADFAADLKAARAAGAAGWCFHNGDQRRAADGRPRRSFDLGRQRLFEQLDDEEQGFLADLRPGEK